VSEAVDVDPGAAPAHASEGRNCSSSLVE